MSDIFSRLRAVQAEWRTALNYNPKTAYLLSDGATSMFLPDVGKACISAYKAGELDAPGFKLFKSEVKAAIVSSGSAWQENDVALHILKWLDVESFNVIGPDANKEPVERMIDALSTVARRTPETSRLEVFDAGGSYTAILDGETHALTEAQHGYISKLLGARGGWYSAPKGSGMRPDRLRKTLPAKLNSIIEAKDGSGTRLTIF